MTPELKNVPRLRFPEFFANWREVKLGNISEKVGSGSTPRGGEQAYQTSGILFIRSQNVYDNELRLDEVVFISKDINEQMRGSFVQPNDILLNITGASIGRSCVVPQSFAGCNVNQHVCIIRLNPDNDPRFLQAFLSSQRGQKLVFEGQTGSGREGLNFQSIRAFKIRVPNLTEQTKIAAFLSAVDDKLRKLVRKKELLLQYKKGMVQQLFNQKVRFKDENGNDFPDWEKKPLRDYLIKFDKVTTQNNQYPVLTSSHRGIFLQTEYFSGNQIASEDNTGYNIVPRGYFTYRHMSDTTVFRFNINDIVDFGIVSTLYPVFTTKHINDEFLKLKLNYGEEFIRFAIMQKQGGSRTYMYFSRLQELEVRLPHIDEQQKIADFFAVLDQKIHWVDQQLAQLKLFKKSLLQQMFV